MHLPHQQARPPSPHCISASPTPSFARTSALHIDVNLLAACRVLESLEHLEKLSLRNNRLASLPPGLFTLPALRELDLSQNDLSELPQDVALLQSLEVSAPPAALPTRTRGF